MRRLAQAACLLVFAGFPSVAPAQTVLTLAEAVREAGAHNRPLLGARSSVREADARVREARSPLFPRVSLTESWQRSDQPVFVFSSLLSARKFTAANFAIDALNNPDPTGFFHGAVSIEQVVFDGGRTRASTTAAGLRRDVVSLTADDAERGLAVATTEAYGRVLIAAAEVRAADAAVAAAQEDLARATSRRDAGVLSDADRLAVSVQLARMRERRIQAVGDEAIARTQLNHLMGSPLDRQYQVEEPAVPASAALPSPEALMAAAEAGRPDLRRASASEKLADASERQTRAIWYPEIVAQAGVEANGTQVGQRASSWLVGGAARWTWSTGGAELAQRAAAIEGASRARVDREEARAAAQVEIVTALRRLESARARQAVADEALAQTKESQRVIRDRFDAGVAGAVDVQRAAAAVVDAESHRISTLVEVIVSNAVLDRAVGRRP